MKFPKAFSSKLKPAGPSRPTPVQFTAVPSPTPAETPTAKAEEASEFLRQRMEAMQLVSESPPIASATAPIFLPSKNNGSQGVTFGGRMARNELVKTQREVGYRLGLVLLRNMPLVPHGHFVVVRMVRQAQRLLDSDNVEGALKAVRDGVAHAFGVDDADPRVRYVVDQEKASHAGLSLFLHVWRAP